MIIIWVAVDGSVPVRSNILYTASVLAHSRNPLLSPNFGAEYSIYFPMPPFLFPFLFLESPSYSWPSLPSSARN